MTRDLKKFGLIEFLKTKRSSKELCSALKVIEEFKSCESPEEYIGHDFCTWSRLEQLEDYLRILTNDGEGKVSDKTAKAYFSNITKGG